jgi:hypothetical protein
VAEGTAHQWRNMENVQEARHDTKRPARYTCKRLQSRFLIFASNFVCLSSHIGQSKIIALCFQAILLYLIELPTRGLPNDDAPSSLFHFIRKVGTRPCCYTANSAKDGRYRGTYLWHLKKYQNSKAAAYQIKHRRRR